MGAWGLPLDLAGRYAMTERVTYNKEMVMAEWVDFNELKQRVSITDVLNHYGLLDSLTPRKGGEELVGLCPFHEERRKSFGANTVKNNFQCFSCKAHGNVIDFVRHKEELGEGRGATRTAALLLQQWFPFTTEQGAPSAERPGAGRKEVGVIPGPPLLVNPPLTFELKGLVSTHPYLLEERGLKQDAIEHFGLGYCDRGLMKGRIVIPVHNERDELVAYCGRWPGEPPQREEKYKMPAGFGKSAVVYNLNRVGELAREKGELIIAEGFFTVFKLFQLGIENVVALMGSFLSEQQKNLLVETLGAAGKVILLFDNDVAGQGGAAQCAGELMDHLFVKQARLPEGILQPDELSDQDLRQLLAS